MKVKINITLDEEVLKKLHKKRGLITLSALINDLLKKEVIKE